MTPQHAKELLPIITAYAKGEAVERRTPDGRWFRDTNYDFSDPPECYRIKPKPVTRPWSKPEDVPGPVCYVRGPDWSDNAAYMVTSVSDIGIAITWGGKHSYRWKEIADSKLEHSTDRKTWLPCTVTEEQP